MRDRKGGERRKSGRAKGGGEKGTEKEREGVLELYQ